MATRKTSKKANKPTAPARSPAESRGQGDELHQLAGGSHPSLTTNQGVVVPDNQNSLRENITHFDHERIPERIVHARGSAAHGYFELTRSLEKYTTAKVLTEVGVK